MSKGSKKQVAAAQETLASTEGVASPLANPSGAIAGWPVGQPMPPGVFVGKSTAPTQPPGKFAESTAGKASQGKAAKGKGKALGKGQAMPNSYVAANPWAGYQQAQGRAAIIAQQRQYACVPPYGMPQGQIPYGRDPRLGYANPQHMAAYQAAMQAQAMKAYSMRISRSAKAMPAQGMRPPGLASPMAMGSTASDFRFDVSAQEFVPGGTTADPIDAIEGETGVKPLDASPDGNADDESPVMDPMSPSDVPSDGSPPAQGDSATSSPMSLPGITRRRAPAPLEHMFASGNAFDASPTIAGRKVVETLPTPAASAALKFIKRNSELLPQPSPRIVTVGASPTAHATPVSSALMRVQYMQAGSPRSMVSGTTQPYSMRSSTVDMSSPRSQASVTMLSSSVRVLPQSPRMVIAPQSPRMLATRTVAAAPSGILCRSTNGHYAPFSPPAGPPPPQYMVPMLQATAATRA